MLSERKQLVLVKLEATYGTDPTPVAADAILVSNLKINPLEGSSVARDFIRPYFGQSGSIRVENYASLTFDTEIAGSGAAGTAPNWGKMLKASNFSETITAAAITGTAQAGGTTTTIKLASGASAVDDFYTGMTVAITAGTGNGQSGEIIGYVGSTKVATIAKSWAAGPDATSSYSIGANVIYTPNSDFGSGTANTSATFHFYVDGVRHILLGGRCTPMFDESVKKIPKISWKVTGLLGTITDTANPSGDFTGWQTPVTVSTANTTDINLLGFKSSVLEKFSFDAGNEIVYRQLVGAESVLIVDRKMTGSLSIEATTIAAKDWWTAAKDSTTGPLCIKHGQTAGNIVGITAPKVQLSAPDYSSSDKVVMFSCKLDFLPYSTAGNDEIRICCK